MNMNYNLRGAKNICFAAHHQACCKVQNCFINVVSVVVSARVLLQGVWEHNRMHGQGIYTDAEGHQWSGQFFNGGGPGLTCLL